MNYRKKKQDEIEAKKRSEEKRRVQRNLEIEEEKRQHEEIKKLKLEKVHWQLMLLMIALYQY